jgi:predicted RNase H-like nuclease
MVTTLIGIDLAWKSNTNHTGIAVLAATEGGVELIDYSMGDIRTLQGVVDYITTHMTENTVIAIDAPLIIRNQTGQRPCETLIGQRFGRFHASAHTSNLKLYPDPNSMKLVELLGEYGFEHHPDLSKDRQRVGRWLFEVYPHAAQIVFFGLEQRIKYKKGNLSQKRAGLEILRGLVRTRFPAGIPSLKLNERLTVFLEQDLGQFQGTPLKAYEDVLDALVCAYIAALYWYWGSERNEMIGDFATGYIINPTCSLPQQSHVEKQ